MLDADFCQVELAEGVDNLFIEIYMTSENHTAKVIIEQSHTNLTYVERDGEVLHEHHSEVKAKSETCDMSFQSIYDFAQTGDISGAIPCLEQQITYNTAISAEGMANNYGSNIGQLLLLDESNPSL